MGEGGGKLGGVDGGEGGAEERAGSEARKVGEGEVGWEGGGNAFAVLHFAPGVDVRSFFCTAKLSEAQGLCPR